MTLRAVIFSLLGWSGFGVYTLVRWTGITFNAWFSPLVVLPYALIFVALKIRKLTLTPLQALFLSSFLGIAGSYVYVEGTIARLSTLNGIVFIEMPLLQLVAVFFWVSVSTIVARFRRRPPALLASERKAKAIE